VDAIVGGLSDVLRDVGVVVLRSHCSESVTGKIRDLRRVAHVKDEVSAKAPDEIVVAFGSGRDNLISGKLG
jgi:hypothetical protein